MQYNPEFPSVNSAPQSARIPTNGAPSTPNHHARRSDSRKSDGASPQTSKGSQRAHSDEYGSTKSDKSIFGKLVSGMAKGLGSSSSKKEKMEISTPYDPIHLTHVGFNYNTGEFTVQFQNEL
jgi:p21-activated kinase 1